MVWTSAFEREVRQVREMQMSVGGLQKDHQGIHDASLEAPNSH